MFFVAALRHSIGMPVGVGSRALGLTLLAAGNALLLIWGSAPGADAARELAAVQAGACAGGAALLWIALDRRFTQTPLWWVMGLALLLRVIAIHASPLLEDDYYRYLWDGMRTATAFDPYRLPPSAFFGQELPSRWQEILDGINHPDIPTIYGPLLQWLFALAHWIAPGRLEPIQMLLLAADMAVLGLLARHGVSTRWLLLYAVHPLILKEAMGSAHPDGVVALLLLLALLTWRRRFAVATGAMLGLAAGAKVAALVVLPLLLFAPPENQADGQPAGRIRGWVKRVAAGFALVLVVLYVPFVWRSGSDIVALGIFGNEWRFNPLLFRLIEVVVPGPAARVLAALLIVAGIGAICWGWRRQSLRTGGQTLPPLDTALVLLLVLSPVVNPWYWLWALPLSVFLGRGWVAAAGVFAAISYFNTSVLEQAIGWNGAGPDAPYAVPWSLALVQLLVLGAAVYADRVGAADKRRLQCNG